MVFKTAWQLAKACYFWQRENKNQRIKFVNFWPTYRRDGVGVYDFMKARCFVPEDRTITFFSCFGPRRIVPLFYSDINIFYSTENLNCNSLAPGLPSRSMYQNFSDEMLGNDNMDLSIGFSYKKDPRYIRFPYWLFYILGAEITDNEIADAIRRMRYPDTSFDKRPYFATLIASHDRWKSRASISDQLSDIGLQVKFPGKFRHNDDSLWNEFNNDKRRYLQQFRFNLCPENTNTYGYVTEKIYEAIYSGCVPIYWGSNNCPDLQVLNQDAIIFFDPDSDNIGTLDFILDLENHPSRYNEFSHLPRLLPGAEKYYIELVHELESKLNDLFKTSI